MKRVDFYFRKSFDQLYQAMKWNWHYPKSKTGRSTDLKVSRKASR